MFACCKLIWYQVRQAIGKQKCHSPWKGSPDSLSQAMVTSLEGVYAGCSTGSISCPSGTHSPRHQLSTIAFMGWSYGWGPPSTALKLIPPPSQIKQSMLLCCLFSPTRCSSPSFLPQVLLSTAPSGPLSPWPCCNTTSPTWHHRASQGREGVVFCTSSVPATHPFRWQSHNAQTQQGSTTQ